VLCGDAIIDLDISAAVAEHKAKGAIASVVTLDVPREETKNYGIVVTDEQGRITSFQEKPKPEDAKSTLASTGIYIFEPEVLDLIPPGRDFDIGSQLFPLLVEKGLPFYAQSRPFNWIDIGRLPDYWAVTQRVLAGEVAQMHVPGREVRPQVWVGLNTSVDWDKVQIEGPVYIGANTKIEAGCKVIGPTWIGHGSHLREGCTVDRSVLMEHTRIAKDAVAQELVISPQYCVNRAGDVAYVGDELRPLRWGDARA
jgi:mannose-1-phosphate guanylyltransferase